MEPSSVYQASDIQGSSQQMSTTISGTGASTKVWSPWSKLEERDLSPVLLEIFMPLESSDSGELEQELRTLQQSQTWKGVSGTVRVIALVYHVPTLEVDTSSGQIKAVPHLLSNLARFRMQKEYAVKSGKNIIINMPQIVVQGTMSTQDFQTLHDLIRSVPRYLSPSIKDVTYDFYAKDGIPFISIFLSLDLRSKRFIPGMQVMVALYEAEAVSDCETGPANSAGSDTTRKFVVRDLKVADTVDSIRYSDRSVAVDCVFSLWKGFRRDNFGFAVFFQYNMQVYGAAAFSGSCKPGDVPQQAQ